MNKYILVSPFGQVSPIRELRRCKEHGGFLRQQTMSRSNKELTYKIIITSISTCYLLTMVSKSV